MRDPNDQFCIDPDELHDIVALCDADGIIVSWNRAGQQTTGFAEEDLRGYHLDSIVSQDSQPALGHILRTPEAGGARSEVALRLLTNYGIEVPVEATSIPRFREGVLDFA